MSVISVCKRALCFLKPFIIFFVFMELSFEAVIIWIDFSLSWISFLSNLNCPSSFGLAVGVNVIVKIAGLRVKGDPGDVGRSVSLIERVTEFDSTVRINATVKMAGLTAGKGGNRFGCVKIEIGDAGNVGGNVGLIEGAMKFGSTVNSAGEFDLTVNGAGELSLTVKDRTLFA
jgi:hypothetical protein